MARRAIAIAAGMLVALSACSSPVPSPQHPDGLEVRVYQTRTDLAERRLEVSIVNGTGSDLTVTRLVFDAPQFSEAVRWPKASTTIRAGVTADLPVLLAAPSCEASHGPAAVELDYVLSDGRSGTAIVVPDDVHGRLDAIRLEDCIARAVAAVATIGATTPPRHELLGDRLVARYDLTVTPTGGAGSVVISGVIGSILISLVDDHGAPVGELPLDVEVDAHDAPTTLTLAFVPGRCDEHAILEDKRGTLVGLRAHTDDGSTGVVWVNPAEPVKQAIYDYVRTACAR